MMNRRNLLQAAPLLFVPPAFAADTWPAQSVRIVVPNPPGGTGDIAARLIFNYVGAATRKPFVVENKAGANGQIGMMNVARSAPDGLSFALPADTATFLPMLEDKPQYTVAADFTPVSLIVAQPLVIVASAQSGIDSIATLIRRAKEKPDTLAYGTSGGTGTTHHVAAARFSEAAGIKLLHVPYKGGGQAVTDLVANQIQLGVMGAGPIVPYAKSGRVRMLAVTSRERSPSLPDVPTLAECGLPGIDITQWFGLYAPAKTPKVAVDAMASRVATALSQSSIRTHLSALGIDAMGGDGAVLKRRQETDAAAWIDAVRRLNIQVGR